MAVLREGFAGIELKSTDANYHLRICVKIFIAFKFAGSMNLALEESDLGIKYSTDLSLQCEFLGF